MREHSRWRGLSNFHGGNSDARQSNQLERSVVRAGVQGRAARQVAVHQRASAGGRYRQYRAANAAVRKEVLGAHAPALTIIITGIYDEEWLLEIEAIAAA